MSSLNFRKNDTIDISIATENDVKSIQIENDVFLLNGDQFYQLKFNKTERYLMKLTTLNTNTSNVIIMFDVVPCENNNFIVILARLDYLEVFEIFMNLLSETRSIQKITTSGGFQGAKAIKRVNGEVILITATYMSKVESILR